MWNVLERLKEGKAWDVKVQERPLPRSHVNFFFGSRLIFVLAIVGGVLAIPTNGLIAAILAMGGMIGLTIASGIEELLIQLDEKQEPRKVTPPAPPAPSDDRSPYEIFRH